LPKIAARLAEFHNLLAKLGHVNLLNHIESTVGTLQSALRRFHLEPLEDFLAQFQEQATSHCWQAVHNDLHEENILIENGQVFFVDLDSASWNSPWMDIASCAYRIGKGDETDMASFVEKYNRSSKTPVNPDMKTLWHFVAFRALQRIIFLLIMRENHQYEWLNDLPWQLRYLNHAIERLGRPDLMKHLDFLRYIVQM
jgi:Ser/Thr protein kinase RdoA (MazF antagonist)